MFIKSIYIQGEKMFLFEKLLKGEESLSVMGLGYVGISTAVAFSKKIKVIGFDLDREKIQLYNRGIDPTRSLGDETIKSCSVEFTHDESTLKKAKFHVIAVPTPVKADNTPDLSQVENACIILGRNLSRGSIVVIESTVYPGMTEDVCIPILEKVSGLECGNDFKIGYSPERINPGDKNHRFENIVKIVSGMDRETLEEVAALYETVVKAGVYRADSIKVAESAKVVENAQRDINIAFMNELSMIFGNMGIDTKSVLEAAGTKWNFFKFYPGLVGGQCISVDPYYLIHCASQHGYESKVISAGREVNDYIVKYISENIASLLMRNHIDSADAKIVIFGAAFKENFPDVRNSKVFDLIDELKKLDINCALYDPLVSPEETYKYYGISLCSAEDIKGLDMAVFAVAHDEFKKYVIEDINGFLKDEKKILVDIKGIFDKEEFEKAGYIYWRL